MTGSEDTHTREARKVKIIFIRILFFKFFISFPDNKSSNETTSDSDEGRNA